MITTEEKQFVKTEGCLENIQYSIKTNSKMFGFLSDKLYKDKIGAVIRELSTNAFDAHVAAGKHHIPFEVHLPNTFEPYFSVKDFGTGLSPEKVRETYVSFGDSDKEQSNDFTGCLGLGSKSPFAIASRFTVCSWFNGKKTLYCAYKDENGIPTLSKMHEEDTKEPNGVEIKIDVNRDLTYEFITKAKDILRWFLVAPKITGQKIEFEEINYLIVGDTYKISEHTYNNSSKVIMGNVAYNIDASEVFDSYSSEAKFLQCCVHIFANIGDVNFTINRETLEYTNKTKKFLKKVIPEIHKDAIERYTKELNDIEDIWEARKTVYKLSNSSVGRCLNLSSILWKNKQIEVSPKIDYLKYKKLDVIAHQTYLYSRRSYHDNYVDQISPHKLRFYLNDLPDGDKEKSKRKIVRFMKDNNIEFAYEIQPGPDCDSFIKDFEIEKFISKVSDIPKPIPKKNGGTKSSCALGTINEFEHKSHYDNRPNWKESKVDINKGGIYVVIRNYKFLKLTKNYEDWAKGEIEKSENFESSTESLLTISNGLESLKHKVTIYGVRPKDVKKLPSNWIYLKDYIYDNIISKNKDKIRKIRDVKQNYLIANWPSAFKNITKNSIFKELIDYCKESVKEEKSDNSNWYLQLASAIQATEEISKISGYDDLWKKVSSKYPLLNFIEVSNLGGLYGNQNKIKSIIEYVDTIEEYERLKNLV